MNASPRVVVRISDHLGNRKPKEIDVVGLYNSCPDKFKQDNEWKVYVNIFTYFRINSPEIRSEVENWSWKTDSVFERKKQQDYFFKVVEAPGGLHYQKVAVLAHLLSKMLVESPTLELQSDGYLN